MVLKVRRPPPAPRLVVEDNTPPPWFPHWPGETVVIVASGPSASTVDLPPAREAGARFIAINTSWKLAPWADVLYGCDAVWWHDNGGVPEFKGLKISQDVRACDAFPDVKRVKCDRQCEVIKVNPPGEIGWGGNSGFHAINLAVQFRVGKIILVGYDMQLAGGLHWHGPHGGRCSNPTEPNVPRWRRVVDAAHETVKDQGIKGFNCSPVSALTQWPKCTLAEALAA